MKRPILLICIFLGAAVLVGCSGTASNKDTISQTNRPPAPEPGTTLEPVNRIKKQRPNENPSATPEATAPQPADENSEFSIKMNEDGSISEFRTFKDHPTISKAEVRWTDPSNKVLTVELKSGKSRTAKVTAEFNLRRVLSEELLTSGGTSAAANAERPRVVKGK